MEKVAVSENLKLLADERKTLFFVATRKEILERQIWTKYSMNTL